MKATVPTSYSCQTSSFILRFPNPHFAAFLCLLALDSVLKPAICPIDELGDVVRPTWSYNILFAREN
jgi:hypothetical protein